MTTAYQESLFIIKDKKQQKTQMKQKHGIPESVQKLGALIALTLLGPIMLIAALAIRIESKGNIVFKQTRVGLNGRRFTMYKFRSMYCADDPRYVDPATLSSDRDGICQKFIQDPRITKVGKIIRKLSIDELPQLFNVLTGDMVLIGPRPALPSETDQYSLHMLERLNSKAGLTGLWQVSGRADTTFEEQIELDIRYVREQSLAMDMYILFATIPAVLMGKGAY